MFNKKDGKSESGITLVASNCELVGDVHFSDQLVVNGTVKGNIYAQSGSKATVNISEKGRVKGEIRVPNVVVNGKVYGDILSDKHIELSAKAEVKGNIYYHMIEMVKGSKVDGHLVHMQDGKHQDVPESTSAAEDAVQTEAALDDEPLGPSVAAVKSKSA